MPAEKPRPSNRSQYPFLYTLGTRWMDNDIYGHVNNVVYYSYFDTIINKFLIETAGLDIKHSEQIGLMVQSQCYYFASVAYPETIVGGFAVEKIGRSSVTYNVAIFKQKERETCETSAALGSLTHVFVDRFTQKSVAIPDGIRTALHRAKLIQI